MQKIIEYLIDFNALSITVRLILALLLGGLIGMERGRHGRAAGMRTHVLVCIGACMTALVGLFMSDVADSTRIAAQVISGIGFLGAGTIMIRNQSVITGLTTAAGLWASMPRKWTGRSICAWRRRYCRSRKRCVLKKRQTSG